jgi:hypothetical protein
MKLVNSVRLWRHGRHGRHGRRREKNMIWILLRLSLVWRWSNELKVTQGNSGRMKHGLTRTRTKMDEERWRRLEDKIGFVCEKEWKSLCECLILCLLSVYCLFTVCLLSVYCLFTVCLDVESCVWIDTAMLLLRSTNDLKSESIAPNMDPLNRLMCDLKIV